MKALQLLFVLVSLLTLCHTIQTEYFVRPNDSTPCTEPLCHTLSHYLAILSLSASGNSTKILVNTTYTSNTKISFLPGVHKIDTLSVLYIENVTNLTLAGYNVSTSHAAKIVCIKPASLMFSSIVNLVVKHLSIIYCGSPIFKLNHHDAEEKGISVAVHFQNITSLILSEISVENSTGYGIMGNILGISSVSHSRFVFSN